MALEAVYRLPFDERDHTLAAAQKGGDIVQTADGYAGVVMGTGDYALGDVVRVKVKGIFDIASASATTFSAGVICEWDESDTVAVAQAAGDFDLGTVVAAKTSGQTTVRVSLNDTKVVVDTDT